MGNLMSSLNSTPGRKRNLSQAQLDDTDECDATQNRKRKKVKSTSEYIYEALYVNGDKSDVTICALRREWRLHKIYLCQSGFFSSMFNGSWKESTMDRIEVDIPDEFVTEEALSVAFGSLYRDDVVIEPGTVSNLLAAASLLCLSDLIQQCADVMRESIDMLTVCSYYIAGRMYGAKDVPESCIKYLQRSIMPNMTIQLLKDISPELMMKLVEGADLFVLQVEMDVYSMLRKWVYLRFHPNYEGNLQDLVQDTDVFVKSEVANGNWKPSLLESPLGAPFVDVFAKVRIEHIINDDNSAKILETDGIVPSLWVLNCGWSQWRHLLRIDNGQDIGPKDIDVETFEKKSMRCGRKLDTEGQYCWRWTGFNYGTDILVTFLNNHILLKRNIPSNNCHCMVAPQSRKHIVYRLTLTSASAAADKQPSDTDKQPLGTDKQPSGTDKQPSGTDKQPSGMQTTGIKHLSMRKDEEVCILTVDRKQISFPLYISCNFLLYTPQPDDPVEPPPVVNVATAAAAAGSGAVAGGGGAVAGAATGGAAAVAAGGAVAGGGGGAVAGGGAAAVAGGGGGAVAGGGGAISDPSPSSPPSSNSSVQGDASAQDDSDMN